MLGIFLDIETTGLDPRIHHPIDIAFQVLDLQTYEPLVTYQSCIKQPKEAWEQRDLVSVEVNGFSWERLQKGKPLEEVASEIIQVLVDLKVERGRAVFICQNPAFDRPFFTQLIDVYTQEELHWPYHWLDLASMHWRNLLQTEKQAPDQANLSKDSIAKAYGLPPESSPHTALSGVEHLVACYTAVANGSSNTDTVRT